VLPESCCLPEQGVHVGRLLTGPRPLRGVGSGRLGGEELGEFGGVGGELVLGGPLEAVDVFGGDACLEGDPLPEGFALEFLELLRGVGGLPLRLLQFGQVAFLELLQLVLELLPFAAFLGEVGEDGVLVALAGLRVVLLALGRLGGSWGFLGGVGGLRRRGRRGWCRPVRTWGCRLSRSWTRPPLAAGNMGGPSRAGVVQGSRGYGHGERQNGAGRAAHVRDVGRVRQGG
jgi:hypothetical protein